MQINPRKFAHKILLKWFTTDFYLEHLINFNDTEISAQDRRFTEALIHQVVMHQRMLDFVLNKFVDEKTQAAGVCGADDGRLRDPVHAGPGPCGDQ